jgi:hypothetical protein
MIVLCYKHEGCWENTRKRSKVTSLRVSLNFAKSMITKRACAHVPIRARVIPCKRVEKYLYHCKLNYSLALIQTPGYLSRTGNRSIDLISQQYQLRMTLC